jgi:hypothetical protein
MADSARCTPTFLLSEPSLTGLVEGVIIYPVPEVLSNSKLGASIFLLMKTCLDPGHIFATFFFKERNIFSR